MRIYILTLFLLGFAWCIFSQQNPAEPGVTEEDPPPKPVHEFSPWIFEEMYFDLGFAKWLSVSTGSIGLKSRVSDCLSWQFGYSLYAFDPDKFDFVESETEVYHGMYLGVETAMNIPVAPYAGFNVYGGFYHPLSDEVEDQILFDDDEIDFLDLLLLMFVIFTAEDYIGFYYPEVGLRIHLNYADTHYNRAYIVISYRKYFSSKGSNNDFSMLSF